ncbi:MAG: site-specific DNA-methyltransferase [Janthinobacterium lividum]
MSDLAAALRDLSQEDLIARLLHQDEEIRMGRAFSNIAEDVGNDATLQWQGRNRFLSEKVIPVQLERSEIDSLCPDKGNHRIINGDNLSVMTSLLAEFRGGRSKGVDVIYLDPPYNTGSDVFSYNDDYKFTPAEVRSLKRKTKQTEKAVSLDDPSRHTKWINHMAPRLWAARKLLKSTGVIIVSIDEHELPRLWMLMEEMFGEKNRIATLVWERSRKNDARYISEGHEYLLVWARHKEDLDAAIRKQGKWRKRKDGVDAILTAYAEAKEQFGDDVPRVQAALDQIFRNLPNGHPAKKSKFKRVNSKGVFRDDGDLGWPSGGGPRYDVMHPITKKPTRIPSSGWRYGNPADMQNLIDEGRVHFGPTHNKIPSLITYLEQMDEEVETSVIQRDGQNAVHVINNILGKGIFNNPKDHEMLAELFNLVTWRNPNALILDAYAGSGTTGHSVLEMNAEDGGNRRFILIESGDPTAKSKINRERYTTDITAERIRRVINGNWADGKAHPNHDTGFTFYHASKHIDKNAIMAATRETLADIILQVVEDDSNRIDCRMDGYQYLIGKTKLGYGIALVWEGKNPNNLQPLTVDIMDQILDEALKAGVTKPVFIYATGNVAPHAPELYRFQHIPDSILARLNLLPGEGDDA